MEHVSSVRPTGKFPEKVENLKRWSRFPGWNFRTECPVPFTFLVVCTSSRSTVGHRATYRGLRPNGTTFCQSEIPLLLPPKFPGFFRKWKAPKNTNCGRFQKRRDWIRQRLKFTVKIIFFDAAIGSKNYALQEHLSKDSGQPISLYTRSNNGFYSKLSSCFFYNEQFRTTIMCDMFTEALHL